MNLTSLFIKRAVTLEIRLPDSNLNILVHFFNESYENEIIFIKNNVDFINN